MFCLCRRFMLSFQPANKARQGMVTQFGVQSYNKISIFANLQTKKRKKIKLYCFLGRFFHKFPTQKSIFVRN